VRSAAVISHLPIQNAWVNGDYLIAGEPVPPPERAPVAEFRVSSPDYFRTLGIPFRAGRGFTEREADTLSRVAIVNEALVRRDFHGENPLGRQLQFDGPASDRYAIIGVVGDVRQAGLDVPPLPEIHLPYGSAWASWMGDMTLVVKTAVPAATITPLIRAAVRRVDPSQPLYRVLTMNEVIDHSLAARRLNLWLLGVFAVIALVLSATGLYGVIAYLVAQRTREIGIRMALGAQVGDVTRLVVQQGARLAAIGIAVGLVGALALTRVLASLLYGVSARDPLTFAGVAAVLGAVALMATYVPARRAARVDPLMAIRSE
jgi:predicted permease